MKKEKRVTIRFSRIEFFVVREKASTAGMSVAEYIRQVSINGQVMARLDTEDKKIIRQLVGMANNLNQLAKACHQEGIVQAMVYFEHYRGHIDDILKNLRS